MATKIKAANFNIVIDRIFVSGKDRVAINGEVVFEGKLNETPAIGHTFGNADISIRPEVVSKFTGATIFHIVVQENGAPIHTGPYDQLGKPVGGSGDTKRNQITQLCGTIGTVIGAMTLVIMGQASGIVPRGVLGSALAGGFGGALGAGVGYAIAALVDKATRRPN
jgi:hypothetical protein